MFLMGDLNTEKTDYVSYRVVAESAIYLRQTAYWFVPFFLIQ